MNITTEQQTTRVDTLKSTKGKFMSVTFVKANGEVRTMLCRVGVTKGVKSGSNRKQNPENVVTVYDVKLGQFRNINVDRLLSVKCGKIQWSV